ncbi:GGDEF domain-containing phosphodiesterase [Parasphingorhabdus sp.]|uniref:putative bifunctional diguanylate cyclase/phosphodiesterase n=1 Tax=Parasphingorhabdus sp. TaxID=2709688 RepID=UPI002F944DE8
MASNSLIAVVDVRDAIQDGLQAISEIAALLDNNGIAILALADQSAQDDIAAKCHNAGATHFLDIANPYADLQQALNFAYRYVENIRGGMEATQHFNNFLTQVDEQWSFSKKALNQNWVSDKLRDSQSSIDFSTYPVTGIYRTLSTEERSRVRGAMGRLRAGSAQAAVTHYLNGEKVIHHLHDTGTYVHGRLERLFLDDGEHGVTGNGWAGRDLLSGLRNGSVARSWIRSRLTRGDRLVLIILGLRNFGIINTAYGRAVGDEIMRQIGQRLMAETMNASPDSCMAARIDGQNFMVARVWEGSPDDEAEKSIDYAEQLLVRNFGPVTIKGRDIGLVARAGIAIEHGSSDEALLIRRAILALKEAMVAGASPVKVSGSTKADIMLEQQLESDLAHALDRDEIAIALQPQIKIDTGQLVGAEALARWNHPKLGFLGADLLFPVAERAGLMKLLSAHIHKLAFVTAAKWPSSLSFLRLSVNVTASDLSDGDFAANIMRNLTRSGFPAERTTLEITESELIGNLLSAAKHLSAVREYGVRIAIDDFGTGYSSLAYLKNLPLDYLKIDSGLTKDISGSVKDQVVVKSIIKMAHSLDLAVIAEGVETEAQLKILTQQGCKYYQGFLQSGPISPDEFEIFALRSN